MQIRNRHAIAAFVPDADANRTCCVTACQMVCMCCVFLLLVVASRVAEVLAPQKFASVSVVSLHEMTSERDLLQKVFSFYLIIIMHFFSLSDVFLWSSLP